MAIAATTIWECMQDATANMVNGGGFNATNATPGTDYSQQTGAHLTITDLVIGADNTTVTSALTAFDSVDPGNILHITAGTGFTVGWYEVVSVTGVVATLDRACGTATSTGGTAYLGGALSLNSTLDDDFFEQCMPGNIIYIKYNANSFNSGEELNIAIDGTAALPITVEGYNTTRGDNPTGTNRPTINGAANLIIFDNFIILRNLIITGTSAQVSRVDDSGIMENCKLTNTSATADRSAIYLGGNGARIINCEISSTNGNGIEFTASVMFIWGCYIHDSVIGIDFAGTDFSSVSFTIFDTCTTAIYSLLNSTTNMISNCVIYHTAKTGTGINALSTGCFGWSIINNIITGWSVGVSFGDSQLNTYVDYNDFYDNTTDVTNCTLGDHNIDVDPGFVDAPSGNFAITGDI